jgi:hypothetical protein
VIEREFGKKAFLFIEYVGDYHEHGGPSYLFNSGGGYRITNTQQIDFHVAVGLNDNAPSYIDLEKFFDRVNHDILMGLVAKRVADKRILRLVRGLLSAGVLADGLVSATEEGTPQGGPLSPLLSNLMLDVLDKELETRGLNFVRYADDCNIYVRSRRAGERVMASVEGFLIKRLKLKVNKTKSAVARPSMRASSWASVSRMGNSRGGALHRSR